MKHLKIPVVGFLLITLFTSCKKETLIETTHSSEEPIEAEAEIFIHRHYDEDLSEEEALQLWEIDLQKYRSTHPQQKSLFKLVNIDFHLFVSHRAHGGTKDDILLNYLLQDGEAFLYAPQTLTINKSDELNAAGWHFYEILHINHGYNLSERVRLVKTQLLNTGNDGLYLNAFNAYIFGGGRHQPSTSKGKCALLSQPNRWLDGDQQGVSLEFSLYNFQTAWTWFF